VRWEGVAVLGGGKWLLLLRYCVCVCVCVCMHVCVYMHAHKHVCSGLMRTCSLAKLNPKLNPSKGWMHAKEIILLKNKEITLIKSVK
jgi:hypothetical protein